MKAMQEVRLGRGLFKVAKFAVYAAFLLAPLTALAQEDVLTDNNIVTAISAAESDGYPVVQVRTEQPVGYRYTVYDSYDPVRVVIDLPGVDFAGSKGPIKVGNNPLQEIRTSSFDLPSGKLGRIELILNRETKYKVSSVGTLFSIAFAQSTTDLSSPSKDIGAQSGGEQMPTTETSAPKAGTGVVASARLMKAVRVGEAKLEVDLDGSLENHQYFHLRSPARLVVDLYGVKPDFIERHYKIVGGFTQLRIGDFPEKTRLVFDAVKDLPKHKVETFGNALIVSWEASHATALGGAVTAVKPSPEKPMSVSEFDVTAVAKKDSAPLPTVIGTASPAILGKKVSMDPAQGKKKAEVKAESKKLAAAAKTLAATIEAVDFRVENGLSLLTISLSAPAETSGPVAEKDLVRFGVKNAKISRALRRTIDASSFPSAVKRVIPYVAEGGSEVRFLSELKGPVPYSLERDKDKIILTIKNEQFAEVAPPTEKLVVPVLRSAEPMVVAKPAPAGQQKSASDEIVVEKTAPSSSVEKVAPVAVKIVSEAVVPVLDAESSRENEFTGEKISLVFDDANIRNILQLIGEVSNLNIIAGEDVKGTITLRLIDVPWDQALNLILESKNLGMLREGNVVRIMPKEQLRAMRQAEMTAVKEEKQLEQTVTEVIPINYTALGNITTPAKELLTDRGKITEDARNKQIIVSDIPSAIEGIKKLAGILDTPERQVMIEARIVEASSSFGRDLGVKWGLSYNNNNGGPGDINKASIGLGGSFLIAPPAAGSVMGNAGMGSGITFGRVGIDSTVLDLRISALESAGYGKVISTPRVSTLNGGTASISQGTKIPYQSSGDDGKAKTEFVDANLSLTVQPVINPDDSIILDITATNSSIGSTVSTGAGTAPAIDTKEAKTKVIVRNGETTVIGGIFVESENSSQAGVPFLMKIPILGHLFRSDNKTNTRSELLVFITPRIVQ